MSTNSIIMAVIISVVVAIVGAVAYPEDAPMVKVSSPIAKALGEVVVDENGVLVDNETQTVVKYSQSGKYSGQADCRDGKGHCLVTVIVPVRSIPEDLAVIYVHEILHAMNLDLGSEGLPTCWTQYQASKLGERSTLRDYNFGNRGYSKGYCDRYSNLYYDIDLLAGKVLNGYINSLSKDKYIIITK